MVTMARKKKVNQELVKMSVDAGSQRKTYGELQAEETMKKMREDSVMQTAKDKLALARYQKIGTVEELREAKKRQTPMVADAYKTEEGFTMDCPACGHTYETEDWNGINYCMYCGQAIKVEIQAIK